MALPVSKHVADMVCEANIGVWAEMVLAEDSWCVVIARERPLPDRMITVYDSPGGSPEPGLDINRPSVQVVVRGRPDDYLAAWDVASQIKDLLLGRGNETRGGDVWASCTMAGDILPLGTDEGERPLLSMTFDFIVHQGDLSKSHRESC